MRPLVLAAAGAAMALSSVSAPPAAAGTLAVDPGDDGVIVTSPRVMLARYTAAGELDPAFRSGGYFRAAGEGLLRQPDGKLITYPRYGSPFQPLGGLGRHHADGSVDESFADAGHLVLDVSPTAAATLTEAGDILIADRSAGVRLRRVDQAGRLDPSLDARAPADFDVGDVHDTPDGTIVGGRGHLLRFTPEGVLDDRFGDGGIVAPVAAERSLVTPAGIVTLGRSPEEPERYVVERRRSDGTLDPAWGTGGRRTLDLDPRFGSGFDAALAESPGGAILAAVTVEDPVLDSAIAVTRLTAEGEVDAAYGTDGTARIRVARTNAPADLVTMPDGTAVLSDHTRSGSGFEGLAVARLTPSGARDRQFGGGDGLVATAFDLSGPRTRISAVRTAISATFTLSSPEAGAVIMCGLNGAPLAPCAPTVHYDDLADGRAFLAAEALDVHGNPGPPARFDFIVNARPPETSLAIAPPALDRHAVARFELAADEEVQHFSCRLDGVSIDIPFVGCPGGGSLALDVAEGEHVLEAHAVDVLGGVDATPVVHRWTVDLTFPDTRFEAAPPTATTSTAARFAFSSSDATAGFECRLDAAAWAPCSSPVDVGQLALGMHAFAVRAVDAAGNADPDGAEHVWRVEEAPGPGTATQPPPVPTTKVLEIAVARRAVHRAGGRRAVLQRLRVRNPLGRRGTVGLCATYPRGWRPAARRMAGARLSGRRVCLRRAVKAGGRTSFALSGRPPQRRRTGTLRYTVTFPGLQPVRGTARWIARR